MVYFFWQKVQQPRDLKKLFLSRCCCCCCNTAVNLGLRRCSKVEPEAERWGYRKCGPKFWKKSFIYLRSKWPEPTWKLTFKHQNIGKRSADMVFYKFWCKMLYFLRFFLDFSFQTWFLLFVLFWKRQLTPTLSNEMQKNRENKNSNNRSRLSTGLIF